MNHKNSDYLIIHQTRLFYIYNLSFLILMFFGILFSPHIAFWSCIFLLIGAFSKSKIIREGITAIAIIMLLFAAVSREIGFSLSDDLIGTYMPILNKWKEYGTFESTGLGIELGIVIYLDFILNFFKVTDARTLLFFCVLFTLTFYLIWVNFFFSKSVDKKEQGIAIAVSLAFIQVGLLTQTLRQEMATPFLLMAIYTWDKKRVPSLMLITLATFIHSSSLVIFVFYLLFPTVKLWGKILIFMAIFSFSLCISLFPGIVINVFNALYLPFLAKKIQYYLTARASGASEIIAAGKFYLLIIVIMIANKIFLKKEISKIEGINKKIYEFCLWGSICNMSFVTLPNASRFFLIIPGFFMYFVLLPISKKYPQFFKFMMIIFVFGSLFEPQRLVGGGIPGFEMWNSYDWFELTPFYYVSELFSRY
ncbi:TPA: EpsG family protein [Raoultella planticola]|nr:EpsG family protein [Raoultella planticola]